jgi:cell division protein FtsQ
MSRRTSTSPPRGLASSRERFQVRADRVRRRPWRLAAWVVAVLALVAALVWLVAFSPVLAVRTVEVVGVPADEVAPIRLLAAVPAGIPMARVDDTAVADRVRQRATLANVSIERSWPSTLVIHASPRVPVLVTKNPQGQLHVVDSRGVAYAQVRTAPKSVPMVHTASEAGLSRDALMAAVDVVEVLPPALQKQTSNVTVSGANLVTLRVRGTTVVWGGVGQPEKKLAVMTALLKGRPKLIDVSAPDTPVTR